MSTTRLTLALPVDTARMLDHTVTQTQLQNDTFQGTPDDRDTLASYIEDAEDEFRAHASVDMRQGRAGVPGDRETWDQVTYEVSGHQAFKRNFTGVASNYRPTEVTKPLSNDRILPFDSTEGDEAAIYRGLGGSRGTTDDWEDVTDDVGDLWRIVDHRDGVIAFHPIELARAMVGSATGLSPYGGRLRELRFAITYRYGALGGSRTEAGATSLDTTITDSDTGPTAVTNAARLPGQGSGGSYTLLIGQEYVQATVDVSADEIDIQERATRGTAAASHDSGDRVQYVPPASRKAVAARAGMQLIQSGRYSGRLPDNDDDVDKSDVLDRLQATWDATVDALS